MESAEKNSSKSLKSILNIFTAENNDFRNESVSIETNFKYTLHLYSFLIGKKLRRDYYCLHVLVFSNLQLKEKKVSDDDSTKLIFLH